MKILRRLAPYVVLVGALIAALDIHSARAGRATISGSAMRALESLYDTRSGELSVVTKDPVTGDATVRGNMRIVGNQSIRSLASENKNGISVETNSGTPDCTTSCGYSKRTGRPFFCLLPQATGYVRSCLGSTDISVGFPVKQQTNGNSMTGTASTGFAADDTCYCYLNNIILPMLDLDDMGVGVQTADSGDSDDLYNVGLYSEDGQVPYFISTANPSTPYTTGVKMMQNSIAAPPALPPGRYWMCAACNDPNGNCSTVLRTNSSATLGGFKFSTTCTNAVMPSSLDNPTATWDVNILPTAFELVDE